MTGNVTDAILAPHSVNFFMGPAFSTAASGVLTYGSPTDFLFVEVKYGTGTSGTPDGPLEQR